MQARRAAVAGTVAIAATVGAFLFTPEHRIVGSNTVAPFIPVSDLGGERQQVCQEIPRVPDGAGFVRVRAAADSVAEVGAAGGDPSGFGPIADLRATIGDSRGPVTSGAVRDQDSGTIVIPLSPETTTLTDARLCVSSEDAAPLALFGELKRPIPGVPLDRREPAVSVTFLGRDSETWFSRLGTIETRYGYGHAGAIATWGVWLSGLLAGLAALLSLWLATRGGRRE